jgi:hypothetical protein
VCLPVSLSISDGKAGSEVKKKAPHRDAVMIKGELKLYRGSYSRALILYSKKDGIGYLSPLGNVDEGSDIFLSTIGCLTVIGIDGLPALTSFGAAAVVVEKFIFCIGSNVK